MVVLSGAGDGLYLAVASQIAPSAFLTDGSDTVAPCTCSRAGRIGRQRLSSDATDGIPVQKRGSDRSARQVVGGTMYASWRCCCVLAAAPAARVSQCETLS